MEQELRPRIAPIEPHQIEAAQSVIYAVGHELFARPHESLELFRARLVENGATSDIETLEEHYLARGAFWVLLLGEGVVGTCGVRPLEAGVCELKRMYFLPEVRGLGWGRRMAQSAIGWARDAEFSTMRLDTDRQLVAARALYQSLGFVEIARYNDNAAELFFELKLESALL